MPRHWVRPVRAITLLHSEKAQAGFLTHVVGFAMPINPGHLTKIGAMRMDRCVSKIKELGP